MSARKSKAWLSVCHACAAGVSIVCMISMGAAIAGAVGAGAAGMAGMSGMQRGARTGSTFTALSKLVERAGLGFLNRIPDTVLRPMLAAILVATVVAAYVGYREHRRPWPFILTLVSSALMYPSIYLWMSEPLYFVSLAGLLVGGIWGMLAARSSKNVLTYAGHSHVTPGT